MFFPMLKGNSEKKSVISAFGGLNLTENFQLGELVDMENMASDKFPSLSPSVKKETVEINPEIKNIQGFLYHGDDKTEMSGFTGVADGKYYYQDRRIAFAHSFMEIPKDVKVDLLNYQDKIIIMPMMYVHEYKDEFKKNTVTPLFSGVFNEYLIVCTTSNCTVEISLDNYSSKSWIKLGFLKGDSVVIKCTDENYSRLNVYTDEEYDPTFSYSVVVKAIVKEVTDKTLILYTYNRTGNLQPVVDYLGNYFVQEISNTKIRVYKRYPEFENACIHANRMWATTKNGKEIYASALGDAKEFLKFQGLSTDSWYTEVGDGGKFTGLIPFKEGILAFKENRIYHILGDRPVNFNIAKRFSNCGSIDPKTVVTTDSAVYFLGSDGVYEYSGGTPVNISRSLGVRKYFSGNAFSDGRKYYISFDGENKLYAYDREKGLWHIEALFNLKSGIKIKSEVYLASSDFLYKMSGVYENKWSATLCDITENSMEHKGINDIFIRIKNGDNSYARLEVSVNGESFSECGFTDSIGDFTFRVPVRFKKGDKYSIKISGEGNSVITDIERSFYIGGRAFSRKG